MERPPLPNDARKAIEEEERCLKETVNCLAEQLQRSSQKLATESKRARELTSQIVAATREEDKALLASDEAVAHAMSHKKAGDIELLRKQIEKPYFARFVIEEQDGASVKQHEYKLGFAANPDCRIIDWRKAPVSKLYYEYREGDEYCEEIQGLERRGTVRLRNSVDIEKRRLRKLSCRYGHFLREQGEWQMLSGSHKQPGGARGTLPDVLALITKEQFATITEDAETAILIQGIAGSGKTTVALHRLAWLLHEDNSTLKPERCAVVVLSKILKGYVQNFLPSIGAPAVPVLTFHEWSRPTAARMMPHAARDGGEIARPADPAPLGVQRVLRSMALLSCLEASECERLQQRLAEVERRTDWSAIPAGLRRILDDGRAARRPAGAVLAQLAEGAARGLQSIRPQHALYAGLRAFSDRLTQEDPAAEESILAVLSDAERIIAADESRLLERSVINQARERVERNRADDCADYALDALVVRLAQLRGCGIVLPRGGCGLHDHIVVDEVQDFSPVDLAVFVEAVKDIRQLTLVGDVSQKIHAGAEFPGWQKLMRHWSFKEEISRCVALTVSHRSTLPIMRLAEHVQGQPQVTQGRPGRVPIWFKCRTESKGISEVIEWLEKAIQRYPTALTAVITPSMQEAKYALSLLDPSFGMMVRLGDENAFSFEEGIIVTDVLHAKGLEFTNVLLWNPSAAAYPESQLGRNMLYTAITRAEENLSIVTWKRPSPLLPPLNSPLVRGINMIPAEDEEQGAEES